MPIEQLTTDRKPASAYAATKVGENTAAVIDVKGLRTYLFTRSGIVKAVDDVSFSLRRGETLAVVGESGCGKSMTALSIMRLVPNPPGKIVGGTITLEGKDLVQLEESEMRDIRGNDISMIFQEPMTSLNPVLTIGHQIAEAVRLHQDLSKSAANKKAVEMLRLVKIPEPAQRAREYPHQLSGGMRQRAMIAMALACNPRVLIADEPTTALDVTIQAQILDLILELQKELGTAIILITHNLGVVAETAQRVIVMYAGKKVEEAEVDALFGQPLHPYTHGLLASIPRLEIIGGRTANSVQRLKEIPGMVPALNNLPPGCTFAPRCAFADDQCRSQFPPYEQNGRGIGRLVGIRNASMERGSGMAVQEGGAARGSVVGRAPIIAVEGLKKHFPVKKGLLRRTAGHVYAVDGVSFSVGEGETLGLVGESGCGKSTVARTVLRLVEPTSGTIRLDGHDITRLGKAALRPHRRQMQIIFQDPFSSLNPRMSAGDIVGEPFQVHGIAHGKEKRGGSGSCSTRWGCAAQMRLSARILRRPAPAHLHRPGAGAEPQADRRRRAGVGPRRVDPGAGHQPDDGFAAREAPLIPVHRARSRGRRAYQPPHRGHVSRQDRRTRRQAAPLHQPAAPLHQARPVGGAGTQPQIEAREAHPLQGDVPSPIVAAWLRLPLPLPLRLRAPCKIDVPALREVKPGHLVACHLR